MTNVDYGPPIMDEPPERYWGGPKVDCKNDENKALFDDAIGKAEGQPGYNWRVDLNDDGVVNIQDVNMYRRLPACG